jgi:hypothetical protein
MHRSNWQANKGADMRKINNPLIKQMIAHNMRKWMPAGAVESQVDSDYISLMPLEISEKIRPDSLNLDQRRKAFCAKK